MQRPEMAAYARVMSERAAAFVASCQPGVPLDIHSAMMQLTLDVLVRSLFGTQIPHAAEVEHLLGRVMLELQPFAAAWRIVLPRWLPVPSRKRLRGLRARLDGILSELISERRAGGPASAGASRGSGAAAVHCAVGRQDLLGRLLQASDGEGSLSERAVQDEAMTLFLAGHETTALALTYALHLLARHPQAESTLLAELEQVLAGRAPRLEDVALLPYTRAVLDEALRLYPPAWAIGRRPLHDVVVAGIAVPRGVEIFISPWVLQRDPRFFPAPAAFRPERWLSGVPARRFAYLPFGAGPRVCIGQHFALTEAVLLLATFVQSLRFELVGPPELELLAAATLRPRHPVLMNVRPRATATP
jgi:cytochrome P450